MCRVADMLMSNMGFPISKEFDHSFWNKWFNFIFMHKKKNERLRSDDMLVKLGQESLDLEKMNDSAHCTTKGQDKKCN